MVPLSSERPRKHREGDDQEAEDREHVHTFGKFMYDICLAPERMFPLAPELSRSN